LQTEKDQQNARDDANNSNPHLLKKNEFLAI
jgi:hypothetical protein